MTELAPGVHWLHDCRESDGTHLHFSEYLLDGPEGYVLVDSGSGLHRESVIERVDALTDGAGPGTVLLSHTTLPHTENVTALEDHWGDVDVVTAVPVVEGVDLIATVPEFSDIMGIPEARGTVFRGTQDLEGRTFTCMKPFLTDVNVSQWIFDHQSRVLITAEAFGHYHDPGQCDATSADATLRYGNVERFYRDKLPFLDQLDLAKVRDAFEVLFDRLDPAYVAPIHGNPVAADDLDDYVDDVLRAMDVSPATR